MHECILYSLSGLVLQWRPCKERERERERESETLHYTLCESLWVQAPLIKWIFTKRTKVAALLKREFPDSEELFYILIAPPGKTQPACVFGCRSNSKGTSINQSLHLSLSHFFWQLQQESTKAIKSVTPLFSTQPGSMPWKLFHLTFTLWILVMNDVFDVPFITESAGVSQNMVKSNQRNVLKVNMTHNEVTSGRQLRDFWVQEDLNLWFWAHSPLETCKREIINRYCAPATTKTCYSFYLNSLKL